jgi:hypothetical protein
MVEINGSSRQEVCPLGVRELGTVDRVDDAGLSEFDIAGEILQSRLGTFEGL